MTASAMDAGAPGLLLLTGCEVFAPERLGRRDVLLGGGRVLAVEEAIAPPAGLAVETVAGDGLTLVPGLVDLHLHVAGAGGEGGPASRTPEVRLSQLLAGGVTSVVGCLGTDGVTRSVDALLMKAKGLRAEGLSAWIWTGSYQVPPPTLLGDVARDLALIEEVIGVGEIAVADHRSSQPTVHELIRLAKRARVGGLLGGKAGLVHIHVGEGAGPFDLIHQAVAEGKLSYAQFLPTHVNRTRAVFDAALEYGLRGPVDLTAASFPYFPDEEVKPSRAIAELLAAGVPLEHVTLSSDACGSLPRFDAAGELIGLVCGEPASILAELADAVRDEGLPPETVLQVATSTPARRLKLAGKGRIAAGADADLLVLDERFAVRHLLAGGRWMVRDGHPLVRGAFEPAPAP